VAFQKFQLNSAPTLREGATLRPFPTIHRPLSFILDLPPNRLTVLSFQVFQKQRAVSSQLVVPARGTVLLASGDIAAITGIVGLDQSASNSHIHFRILPDHWRTVRQSSLESLLSLTNEY
jgi:hypothetical protein